MKPNEPMDWAGGRGVFRAEGKVRGTATLRHVEHWPNGNKVDRGVVAAVDIPGEHVITLSPGTVAFDACDVEGQPVACAMSFAEAPSGQKAVLALDILPLTEAEARKRQGTRNDIQERIPESQQAQSRDHAAQAVGVNPRYVSDAKVLARAKKGRGRA